MATEPKEVATENATTKSDTKICGVCGDKALGYNFGAVTCESCKAFFRRNAPKNKEFRCPFNENCEITIVTRRFCQRCRLKKCFAVGMRKDYIMSEEDKVMKRQKIEQNRARKRPFTSNQNKFKPEPSQDSFEYVDHGVSLLSPESSSHSKDGGPEGSPPPAKMWIGSPSDERLQLSPLRSQHVAEPYPSPSSATSASSPTSPPENNTINGSRTPDMLCDSESRHADSNSGVVHQSPQSHRLSSSQAVYKNSLKNIGRNREMPLLSSLINNHKVDELLSKQYAASAPTTVTPNNKNVKRRESGEWRNREQDHYHEHEKIWKASGASSISEAAKEILQDVQRVPGIPNSYPSSNSYASILSEAIKLEFEAYSSLAKTHQNSRELNDAERAKLNELIVANKALHDPLDDDISALVGDDCRFKASVNEAPVLLDVINLTAVAIRRLIKTAKKINAFKNMCQEDQVALLKGGCTEILMLRSAMSYDPDNHIWKIPHSKEAFNVKVDVLKEANGNIYEEHQRFLRTFDPEWRTDENIMLILSAITLFTPDRPRVVHDDVIRLEQNSYYYLLRRYLESQYPGCEARSTFLKLIQKIAELHRLNDELVRVYLDVNPRDVEPLLIEIFDLKPH
ncbi:nuclear hormone receptor HR96 [Schistocerca americana]|uniref:nuclear hormone receptor HR96 n=1 Tax=Schistocerca americana TaxID=7009 RepID=UPI001F4F49E7|nr:nuclear hormone receptor HR96 [Schistocerca americana]XP_046993507.1 nuclear hormone receptor HR96 [Schistocerca americana]